MQKYPPKEARRIIKKSEIHYTSGSQIDVAEIELNVITRQYLSHQIGSINILWEELAHGKPKE